MSGEGITYEFKITLDDHGGYRITGEHDSFQTYEIHISSEGRTERVYDYLPIISSLQCWV